MRGATIKPASAFCPKEDAEAIHKAMKLFGANEAAISHVLCNRSNAQRQRIAAEYETLYGRALLEDLESELWGEFKDLMLALLDPPDVFTAKQLYAGIAEKRSDICMAVMSTTSNHELIHALEAYENLYKRGFTSEFDHAKVHHRGLQELLVKGNRKKAEETDQEMVEKIVGSLMWQEGSAMRLYKEPFYRALATESQTTLRRVIREVETVSGQPIDELIRSSLPGEDNGHCLVVAVKAILHPHTFLACWGLPSTHHDVIRIVVGRAEKDLADIHQRYEELYDESFEDACSQYASGSYQQALLHLIKPMTHL